MMDVVIRSINLADSRRRQHIYSHGAVTPAEHAGIVMGIRAELSLRWSRGMYRKKMEYNTQVIHK